MSIKTNSVLTKKASLVVIAVIILPMLLIFWYSSTQASLAIQLQAGKALLELNKQNHATLDKVMASIDQNSMTMLGSDLVQRWLHPRNLSEQQHVQGYVATEKYLSDFSSSIKYSLFVMKERPSDYNFAPSTDISASGVFFIHDADGKPWLQHAIEAGGKGIVEVIDRFGFNPNHAKTIAYIRALPDLKGERNTYSILVATEIENELAADLNAVTMPKNANVIFTDSKGMVLAGSAPIGSIYAVPGEGKQLMPNVWVAHRRLYIYNDSLNYDNRLVYEIPLHSLVGPYHAVQKTIQRTALCYFIILLIFLLYLGRSVLRPLARLARLARSYAPGMKLTAGSADMDRKDEIGLVFRSFYLMTERLNQTIKDKYVMEIKQKEAELNLLHSQMTPHLLYNTLDSIYWYGIRGGVPEVAELVRDLSTILRIGLSRGREIITVREELQHVQAYLQLQEKRYNHSFHYHIETEEGLEDVLLPKLIIQPLVENSILHGIGKMVGEGEVRIVIRRSENELLIIVEDNGFRKADIAKIRALLSGEADPDKGFGIRNVNKRIRMRFGDRYGLTYHLRDEGGTKAVVRLPVIRSMDELPLLVE